MKTKTSISKVFRIGIIGYFLWFISFSYSIIIILQYKNNYSSLVTKVINKDFPPIVITFFVNTVLGTILFMFATLCIALFLLQKKQKNKRSLKSIFIFLLKLLVVLIGFPFYTLVKLIQYETSVKGKKLILPLLSSFIVTCIFIPIWLFSYLCVGGTVLYVASGIFGHQPVYVELAGTGSMSPTFPKGTKKTDKERADEVVAKLFFFKYPGGITLFGKHFFNHTIARGDIVDFSNQKTIAITEKQYNENAGFIKRVIGLPGDTLELRDGLVYINGKPLKEPYIASAHSTFGEGFLSECKVLTIPQNKVFVMGDNRKGSEDSRDIGLVDLKDIESYLSLEDQKGALDKHWRNTSNDLNETSKIKLDKTIYLNFLNDKRKAAGVPPLRYEQKLEETANKRGQIMLQYDDFSFEATKSGYTMNTAMNDVGYFDPITGESESQGYFTADELIDNQFAFPDSQKFVLDKTFQDVGISEVEGAVNGCPTEVIVEHFAGYVPPNYTQDTISSWQKAVSNLQSIQSGWASLKNQGDFYTQHKEDIDRINDLISQRLANDSEILGKMQANVWLTAAETRMENEDEGLANQINALADKLNNEH